jgi:hypothetical protein
MLAPRRFATPPAGVAAALMALMGAACTATTPGPTPTPAPTPTAGQTQTPPATPTASPSPAHTPRFTNEPDPELAAIIPAEANGVALTVAPVDEFGLTPGDVGAAYGPLGDRFATLAVAYATSPRTSLYAVRVAGEEIATEELEPYLATAANFVGIAGLHREPWRAATVGGHVVWVRPEDDATAAGTMIYTWAAREYVFLLIGVDDAVNRAIVSALPGEVPPTPVPRPTQPSSPSPTSSAGPSGD